MRNLDRDGTRQISQPSIGEMIAEKLRDRIISGELKEGVLLPRQEDLMREFNVSRPPMREALRILEAEGLILVRRGNVGGAVVRAPDRRGIASALGLLLQFEDASLRDLADALVEAEPLCAGLAAEREDRIEAVVPELRRIIDGQAASLDDGVEFTALGRAFHEAVIAGCGNATIRLTVGALATLWSTQEQAWADVAVTTDSYPPVEQRQQVLQIHQKIVDAIEAGDRQYAMALARSHGRTYHEVVLATGDRRITLTRR